MQFQRTSCLSLLASSLLAVSVAPAQAFTFTTHFTGSSPEENIFLNSVQLQDGTLINDFSFVSGASIISNDLFTGGNTGAASADLGDRATVGLSQEAIDNSGVVAALGNANLNSIIDSEDRGSFAIDLAFDSAVDNLFFWERGKNSTLYVQALDAVGNPTGNLLNLFSRTWQNAGFMIDTREISGSQVVGSYGVSLTDLGVLSPVSRIRVTASGVASNGPDFKVVGSAAANTPEPAFVTGLGLVAGAIAISRRKTAKLS